MMVADGIMADGRRYKVAGDDNGTLVDQLIKSMLAVRSRFTPDYRPRGPGDGLSVPVDVLPIAFHISLLEISRKTVHILIIGQNGFRLCAEEVGVPKPDEGHRHWDILFERSIPEVKVGLMRSLQQGLEVVVTDGEGNRQTDGAPERITAADPVPELEHIRFVDAEFHHVFFIGGKRYKMFGHLAFVFGRSEEPVTGRVGV